MNMITYIRSGKMFENYKRKKLERQIAESRILLNALEIAKIKAELKPKYESLREENSKLLEKLIKENDENNDLYEGW